MKITEIEIGYAETVSLPGYNNVRPSVRLVAQVEDGEYECIVLGELRDQARDVVQQEVDRALMTAGKSPKYYDGPRCQVMIGETLGIIAVFPDDLDWGNLAGHWRHPYLSDDRDVRDLAPGQARALAQRSARGSMQVIDCSDGDLTRLPEPRAVEEPDQDELDECDEYEYDDEEEEHPF